MRKELEVGTRRDDVLRESLLEEGKAAGGGTDKPAGLGGQRSGTT